MDGRAPWDLEGSIRERQRVMSWCGHRDIPVELTEPHHRGMRAAPDMIFVVSAFLSTYNAKLANNKFRRATIRTQIVNGACEVVDTTGVVVPERFRLSCGYKGRFIEIVERRVTWQKDIQF